MRIKIYCGLSISKAEVRKHLPSAVVSQPIKRLDLHSDIKAGYHVIGIIDGVFYQQLAVSPSEILDALRVGIKVFGSSSMGALRAAELSPLGMVGIGQIFNHISKSKKFEDDFLGQVFFYKKKLRGEGAFIDTVMGLLRLTELDYISQTQCQCAINIGRNRHFSERTIKNFIEQLRKDPRFKSVNPTFYKKLKFFPSTKKADALALLRAIKKHKKAVKLWRSE